MEVKESAIHRQVGGSRWRPFIIPLQTDASSHIGSGSLPWPHSSGQRCAIWRQGTRLPVWLMPGVVEASVRCCSTGRIQVRVLPGNMDGDGAGSG